MATTPETDRTSGKFAPVVDALVANEGEWWTSADMLDHVGEETSLTTENIGSRINKFARDGFTAAKVYDPLRTGRIVRRGVRGSYEFTWLKGLNTTEHDEDDSVIGKMFEVIHVTPGGNWLVSDGDYEFLVTPVVA